MNGCGMPSMHIRGSVSSCGSVAANSDALTTSCPAKLNVFLEVTGKRADGYHELDTVMLRTRFADQLTVVPAKNGLLTLRFSDATPERMQSGIPLDQRNLILRAAEALRSRIGISDGAEFIVHKRIPPESGLGGGSSNAASSLLLCRQLWAPDVSDLILHEIAASLGSDINFLLSGHSAAICRGRGEIIEPLPLARRLTFVALRPNAGNSTPAVFRATKLPAEPRSSSDIAALLSGRISGSLPSMIFNRLTEAAEALNPEMSRLMHRLRRLCRRPVFMSGSGSTVFVVASSHVDAIALQTAIQRTLKQTSWLLDTAPSEVA